MLSVMLGFGVASRLIFGWVLNRIGGLPTLLLGSTMQAVALALYLPLTGWSALRHFRRFRPGPGWHCAELRGHHPRAVPAQEAGFRVSLAISTTLAGMALGGCLAGGIYDWTGSYRAALVNDIVWNLTNMAISFWMLQRTHRRATSTECAS